MKNSKEKANQAYTIIGSDVFLEGNIYSKGSIRIDGMMKGRVECESILVIGENGRIEGDVVAAGVLIAGEVLGNVTVKDHVELRQNGKLHGDIITAKLVMEPGVVFEGKCRMSSDRIVPYASDVYPQQAAEYTP